MSMKHQKQPPEKGQRNSRNKGKKVQKAKDFKGTLKRLVNYLKPFKVRLLTVLLTALFSTIFTILSPKILGFATTELFQGMMQKIKGVPGAGIDFGYILEILSVLGGLYLFSALFAYIQQYVMAGVSQKVVYALRKEVNAKLSRLPLQFFDSHKHGDILSRAINDLETISTSLQRSLTQLITSMVTLIGIIVMMLTISPIMTFIVLVTLPLSLIVTAKVAARSQKFFRGQLQVLGMLNSHVEEMYSGHVIVKAFGLEDHSVNKFNALNEKLYELGRKAQFISGLIMPLLRFINNIVYVLICVVGSVLVMKRAIQVGDIQAFILYVRQFSQPITRVSNIANTVQATVASAERVFEILDKREEDPEIPNAKMLTSAKGHVRFENVTFGYQKDNMLIQNMNIDVKQGNTVAIVGPTGAGKTTLVNLLMRFCEIDGGKITIDGIDIRDMERGHLRSFFGIVLQDTWLFNGSIRDNIAYGRENATEDEIIEAARAAHADYFIRTLPNGYDTLLNEDASNISQGQRQLLTIARAILSNPAILILDEATSSIDTRTEVQIQKALNQMMAGRTCFVLAHRFSTIRDADTILVMNHGTVIEKGSHDELLAKGDFYADLYNSQFAHGTKREKIAPLE
ncbi:ATP-binding cassette subfamily B protein [Scopulibacillus darangshiensis]|uniref:ATP-binding cassette subfamily B protein n=1 Tax=Scopulibacillus darangshiensis TaxID=442528 RepID=A0A4R2NEH4_9BACL|nr:ABC transporter ATP-binding protein [Scopulibacillus darangshiensis]TCP19709.1 ATP-binding cassette subfamily B protein [Scopulibacillus darangshiensis]